jgi:hypothetical protein
MSEGFEANAQLSSVESALHVASQIVGDPRSTEYARIAIERGGTFEIVVRVKPDVGRGIGVQVTTCTKMHKKQIMFRGGLS